MTSTKPTVHLYTLSQLVYALPGSWERKIKKIEEGRERAYGCYQPVREAIASFCAANGSGRERIVARMMKQAQEAPRGRGQNPERDNMRAFKVFEEKCYSKIGSFVRSLIRRPQGLGVSFESVLLRGAPHLEVTDKDGESFYVFVSAAKWPEQDLKAYLELLSIVVQSEFDASPSSIWHMDLRRGGVSKYRPSMRVKKRCADAAQHYARIFGGTK